MNDPAKPRKYGLEKGKRKKLKKIKIFLKKGLSN